MNSRKSQTFVGRPAEPGVYYILINPWILINRIYFGLDFISIFSVFIRNWRQDTRNKRAKRLRRPFYGRLAGGLQFHGSLWA